MSTLTIGIDPGLSGALGILDSAGEFVGACDLPVIRDRNLAWIDGDLLRSVLLGFEGSKRVVIERVSAMPKQGVASSFQFGVGFGSILGVVQSLGLPLELVTPVTWKRALGLSSEKHASLHKARLLFPAADLRLAKHDGRAEALLIAHWAARRAMPARAGHTGEIAGNQQVERV